jgi:hypothetical protein
MKNMDKTGEKMPCAALRRAIRHSSFVICLGLFCLLFPAKGFAQSANRWLFVFNTSASMRDRVKGTEGFVYDLLTTGMHGNIRAGDTIGIWTYNNQLSAEEAPLQQWSLAGAQTIMQNTMQFIDKHPYEKSAVFGDVLTNMLRVIKDSDVITVILISDGGDSFKGNSFDAQLTSFYKTNYQSQKKAKMPIVTLFRGEKGTITTNTFALAPWPLDIPAVPPPPVVAKVVEKPAQVVAPKPVPSLVIIGKKAETTFNPPQDLPDHVDQVTLPAAVEQPPIAAKPEVPPATPAPAPITKLEEKPAPVVAPVVTAPTPPPTLAAVPPKSVESAIPVAATTPAPAEPGPTVVTAAAPAPAQTVAAAPATNFLSVRNIAIFSGAFTGLVCGFLLLAARNARNASRASLITRSLDRERK